MIEALLCKLRQRDLVSPEEEEALRRCIVQRETVAPGRIVVERNRRLDRSILLLDGLMCRYKDLAGGQRQITALHVPGDFLDLHGFTLKRLDHDVASVSQCEISYASHRELLRITETFPHLTRLLWLSTNLDAALHREWELSLGQRLGTARAAHLFCELFERLRLIERVDGTVFPLPLTQQQLGECLGLTLVHTNRVLRDLRERGLVAFAKKVVRILDLDGLQDLAEFDGSYLYLEQMPR